MGKAQLDLEDQGFEVGAWRMGSPAGLAGIEGWIRDGVPGELGQEGARALHDRIMLHQQVHRALVKGLRFWYDGHGRKLLAGVWLTTSALTVPASFPFVKS